MIAHTALTLALCYGLSVVAFGSPRWVKVPGLWDTDTRLSAHVIALGVNAALMAFRLVWFFFAGGSSWYGAIVLLLLVIHQVMGFLGSGT
jgi:hypothetical protein